MQNVQMLIFDHREVFLLFDQNATPSLFPYVANVDDILYQGVKILSIEEASVNDGSADRQVVNEQEKGIGGAEPRWTNGVVFLLVEAVVSQNSRLIVGVAVGVENGLRHERIGFSSPYVSIVDGRHQDIGQEDSHILVKLSDQGSV